MAAVTGLTLVKKFHYRDNPNEEFSNTYHFKAQPPGDDASWTVLMNDVVNHEKQVFVPNVSYVRAYGYNSDDPNAHHVFQHDFEIPGPPPLGTLTTEGGNPTSGDQAACVQWRLNRLNKRGKPIYLRKYFHQAFVNPAEIDRLDNGYFTALGVFGNIATGVNSVHGGLRSPTVDDVVTAYMPLSWITTRTLKRRGKRPVPQT